MRHAALPADAGTLGQHNYGRFGNEAATLAALRDRLAVRLDPLEIRLFGSRARGKSRPDSDFDLLVVFDDAVGDGALDYDRAYAPLLGLGIGCDVVPCLKSDFDAERDLPGTLPYEAARGRVVYRRGR
ncbi:nucleotidyltransferase family protein [Azospirillum sp. sgz301742]